jgi:CDP-paratose 2-epimerase
MRNIIGGIESLRSCEQWRERVERRVEEEGLQHLRLMLGASAWAADDEVLAPAVARVARRVELVVVCAATPQRMVARPEILRRWARWLAEHGGAIELPAEPPACSIWRARNASPGLVSSLLTAASLVRDAGGRVVWGLGADATRPAVLDALARSGPVLDEEALVLDVRGVHGSEASGAASRVRARWKDNPLWLCAGDLEDRPRPELELERFASATEHGADRVYWSGAAPAPVRTLWRRMGERRVTPLLARRASSRVSEPRVLVTGGAGFVGCNLVARLRAQGRHVVVLDDLGRPGVERNLEWLEGLEGGSLDLVPGDVRSPSAVRRALAGVDQVFHLAGQVAVTTSLEDPVRDFDVNARGALVLLEELRRQRNPAGVVFTSTNKVYGDLVDVALEEHDRRWVPTCPSLRAQGVDESRPLDLHSPYGCSKGAADQYMLDYARSFGVPAVVVRMSCIYGPHQLGTEDQGWVAHFLRQAIEGRTLTIYGDGKQVRDVLFVDDLVDALVRLGPRTRKLQGTAFNVGGGPKNTLSLLELVEHIGQLHGRRPPVRFGDWRRGDQRYYVSNTGRLQAAIDWQPRVSVVEGLRRLHEWLTQTFAPRRAHDPMVDSAEDTDAITVPVKGVPVSMPSIAASAEPCAS